MEPSKKDQSKSIPFLSAEEVRHLAGSVGDDTIAAIQSSGASFEEVEIAAAYLQGEGNELDRRGHHLEGRVAQVYDILAIDPLYTNFGDER